MRTLTPRPGPAAEVPHVLVLRDGVLLGADGYQGGPAVLIEWTPDSGELRRREDRALGRCSGVLPRVAKK